MSKERRPDPSPEWGSTTAQKMFKFNAEIVAFCCILEGEDSPFITFRDCTTTKGIIPTDALTIFSSFVPNSLRPIIIGLQTSFTT